MRHSHMGTLKKMNPSLQIYLLLLLTSLANGDTNTPTHVNYTVVAPEMVPVTDSVEPRSIMVFNETRRRLGSFQICALCTCCGGPKGLCLPSPCCYAINCNIPNRPFGFCSFTPKSCTCFGCNV